MRYELGSKPYDFLAQSDRNRMRAIRRAKLESRVLHVLVDRSLGDIQNFADFRGGLPSRRPGQDLAFADRQLVHARAGARRCGKHLRHARRKQSDQLNRPRRVVVQIRIITGQPDASRNPGRLPERNDETLAHAVCVECLNESLMSLRLDPRVRRLAVSEWFSDRSRPGADMVNQIKPLVDVAIAKARRRAFREDDRIGALSWTGQVVDSKGCKAESRHRTAKRRGDLRQRARSGEAFNRVEDQFTVQTGIHARVPARHPAQKDTPPKSPRPDEIALNIWDHYDLTSLR